MQLASLFIFESSLVKPGGMLLRVFQIFGLSFMGLSVLAQNGHSIKLEQDYFEASAGDGISFLVENLSEEGQIEIRDAPEGAVFTDSLVFNWQIPENAPLDHYVFEFLLMKGSELMDVRPVIIKVIQKLDPPTMDISSPAGDNQSIYHLNVDQDFTLETLVVSETEIIYFSFYFNENFGNKELEGAKVTIEENQLSMKWTPTRKQLDLKYFSMTIIARDSNGQESKKTLLFIVRKNNQSPYFIYPILDEYYVSGSEKLEIDFSTGDPEGDSIIYNLDIPTKIGNPRLTESGLFTWKLSEDQIMRLRRSFPIEVTVEATEIGVENPNSIIRRFKVNRSIKNQPPKILNLQNARISEGLTYKKTVFIQDGNDQAGDLEVDIRGAPEGMNWEFRDNMLTIEWTPGFDVIGVELKPENFDMLLIVTDPLGYSDQRAFTIIVEHRENTAITYQSYLEYRDDAVIMVESLSQLHVLIADREVRIQSRKKSLSVLTMLFAAYTATGNLYEEGSFGHTMVPFVGSLAVIAGGINAFGYQDLPKYSSIRENSYVLQQKLMYVLAILNEYNIDSPNSPNLENAEFRENLKTFEQWMVKDKLDFKQYYSNFLTLNYVKKQIKKQKKEALDLNEEPSGIYFLDLDSF